MVVCMVTFIKQYLFLKSFLCSDVESSGELSSEVVLLYACPADGEIMAGRLNRMSQGKRQGQENWDLCPRKSALKCYVLYGRRLEGPSFLGKQSNIFLSKSPGVSDKFNRVIVPYSIRGPNIYICSLYYSMRTWNKAWKEVLGDKHFTLYMWETGDTRVWFDGTFEPYVCLGFWFLQKRGFGPLVSWLIFSFVKWKS